MADMPRHDSSPTDSVPIAEREFVLLLISLYRDCPELWNVKSKDYLNKIKRSNAIQKILKVLRIYKPQYNEEMFKRKINTLRTNFNKEWQKLDTKKRSGASADEIPEPSLWYFHELTFIKDQVEKTDTKSSEVSTYTFFQNNNPILTLLFYEMLFVHWRQHQSSGNLHQNYSN